jgi:adenylate cyclase
MAADHKSKKRFYAYLLGALLTTGLGLFLLLPLGDGLARLSYDFPFLFQSGGDAKVVMVYVNAGIKRDLGEPEDVPLNRRYYTQLIDRLHRDGARLVFFDFISFDEANPDPVVDREFSKAARSFDRVVVVTRSSMSDQLNIAVDEVTPVAATISASVVTGLCNVDDVPDHVVRRIFMGTAEQPSAAWAAASLLGAPATHDPNARFRERWVNYYGPPGSFKGVALNQALETNGLPQGFFRDKIIVVGSGSDVALAGATQDEFANPYSRFGAGVPGARKRPSYGAEVQAQTLLNLINGDWLEQLNPRAQAALIIVWGFICAFGLSGRRPWNAALLAIVGMGIVGASAVWMQLKVHLWWDWGVLMVQTPVALVWSVGYQYVTEFRRRQMLRQAFGLYLSPYMAERIANSQFDLSLGGTEVEATVMFTDLEGFTKMSESLAPQEVSKILTTYFNQTTRVILHEQGTIIKYIGDAVMAVWGAPMADERHAERAVIAAWGMNQAGKERVEGRQLRTRIGINTGKVLAGNLGSDFRFDYTLIGDTTNFASRLEGLNKYLGTDILISESTRLQLSEKMRLRCVGRFIVSGKKIAVKIYEVLGPGSTAEVPEWLARFDQGLECFIRRDFDNAERLMREVIALRDGKDGPAQFYLKEIATVRLDTGDGWDGSVRLHDK